MARCNHVFVKGERKGEQCSITARNAAPYCSRHSSLSHTVDTKSTSTSTSSSANDSQQNLNGSSPIRRSEVGAEHVGTSEEAMKSKNVHVTTIPPGYKALVSNSNDMITDKALKCDQTPVHSVLQMPSTDTATDPFGVVRSTSSTVRSPSASASATVTEPTKVARVLYNANVEPFQPAPRNPNVCSQGSNVQNYKSAHPGSMHVTHATDSVRPSDRCDIHKFMSILESLFQQNATLT